MDESPHTEALDKRVFSRKGRLGQLIEATFNLSSTIVTNISSNKPPNERILRKEKNQTFHDSTSDKSFSKP